MHYSTVYIVIYLQRTYLIEYFIALIYHIENNFFSNFPDPSNAVSSSSKLYSLNNPINLQRELDSVKYKDQ
jgi:pectate lyase